MIVCTSEIRVTTKFFRNKNIKFATDGDLKISKETKLRTNAKYQKISNENQNRKI